MKTQSVKNTLLRTASVALLSSALISCSSDGDDMTTDNNIVATFSSLKENVFTPSCTGCHSGDDPSAGLDLTADAAFASLAGTGSTGIAFVVAGAPGDSYLIKKLEGADDINGQQMPRGREPLPAATIQAVRDWITAGAMNN